MKKMLVAAVLFQMIAAGVARAGEPGIPEAKRTVPGLYVTAAEAYARWKADPDNVKIIDVRTPEEYVFVGHPAMARNIPLKVVDRASGVSEKGLVLKQNPDFVTRVKRVVCPRDTILVTCRSGKRSAPAVNLLAEAGLKNVYSIIDGVEGDKVKDPANVFHGKRMKNGWKNSGLPWTYDIDLKLVYLSEKE